MVVLQLVVLSLALGSLKASADIKDTFGMSKCVTHAVQVTASVSLPGRFAHDSHTIDNTSVNIIENDNTSNYKHLYYYP